MNKRIIVLGILVTIGIIVLCYFRGSEPVSLIKFAGLIPILFIIADIDKERKVIPNRMLLVLVLYRTICFLVEWIVFGETAYFIYMLTSVVECVMILLLICILRYLLKLAVHKEGIGFGDIKLIGAMALYFSINELLLVLILSLLCFLIKEGIWAIRRKGGIREMISFAPYILVGTLIYLILW